MRQVRRYGVTVTTDGSGVATAYIGPLSGKIEQIEYIKDATTAYTDGVDFTITGEDTGIGIWTEANVNASTVRAPRQATHTQAGVASLYASGGVAVNTKIALSGDRVKIVLAQGGAAKLGRFEVTVS